MPTPSRTVHAQTRRFAAGMAGHDVLLVPTLLTGPPPYGLLNQPRAPPGPSSTSSSPPPDGRHSGQRDRLGCDFLPFGRTRDGLPIGVQLMAPDETILLSLAGQLERAAPWATRTPARWVERYRREVAAYPLSRTVRHRRCAPSTAQQQQDAVFKGVDNLMVNQQQADKMTTGKGFIAALDQSGGSTPRPCVSTGSRRAPTPPRRRCST